MIRIRPTILAALLCSFSALAQADETLPSRAQSILQKHCQTCHGAAMKMSQLDLRTRESMLKGGTRGAALKPGDASKSLLIDLVAHKVKPEMPPGKKLSDAEIDTLREWIDAGAEVTAPIVSESVGDGRETSGGAGQGFEVGLLSSPWQKCQKQKRGQKRLFRINALQATLCQLLTSATGC